MAALPVVALVVAAVWKRFRAPDFRALSLAIRGNLIVDGRNLHHAGSLRRLSFDSRGVDRDNN